MAQRRRVGQRFFPWPVGEANEKEGAVLFQYFGDSRHKALISTLAGVTPLGFRPGVARASLRPLLCSRAAIHSSLPAGRPVLSERRSARVAGWSSSRPRNAAKSP